ncbi:Hypothetical predicted protein [Pelobates cultripes]|uniref:Uncharacterized protein n=1 Tax=Pelobates cultripes TaxID=61616 RepID=A0AAD1S1J5_PELCU|nr:Hypothetical predicted protein [Pelobates cultripes]
MAERQRSSPQPQQSYSPSVDHERVPATLSTADAPGSQYVGQWPSASEVEDPTVLHSAPAQELEAMADHQDKVYQPDLHSPVISSDCEVESTWPRVFQQEYMMPVLPYTVLVPANGLSHKAPTALQNRHPKTNNLLSFIFTLSPT